MLIVNDMTPKNRSPFQYGTLATKENFVDRVNERAMLKQFMTSGINVMLISPRRWGKSSLVKMATEEMCHDDKTVRVCYIDAFAVASESEFYRLLATKVIECAAGSLRKGMEMVKKFLTGIVPQLVIKDDLTEYLTFDLRLKPGERDKLEILDLAEKIASARGLRIVVCIDEFQQLANLREYKDMEGKMRSVWQHHSHVSYCFYGSKRHMMVNIFNNASSPFYHFGQVIFLNKIAAEDWIPFIIDRFKSTEKKISYEVAQKICDITECHSWYLQQLCFFLWSRTEGKATEQLLEEATEALVDTNSPMFINDTDKLTSSQIQMLLAINDGESQLSSDAVVRRYDLGNANTINRNKRLLQERDFIEKRDGSFAFCDPIYRLWFNRQYRSI